MSDEQVQTNNTWTKLEPTVSIVGKFSWALLALWLIVTVVQLINELIEIANYRQILETLTQGSQEYINNQSLISISIGVIIWVIIRMAIVGIVSFIFVLPFAKKCGEKQWHYLKNDVIALGGMRIPKMVALAVGLAIFSYGWGALAVIACVICITFLEPEPVVWKA